MMNSSRMKTYHFEGTLKPNEGEEFLQCYLHFPFDVPEGVSEIHLRLAYFPLKVWIIDNLITLGLFDPDGFRGNAHRHPPDSGVVVSLRIASPGFMAGAIIPGTWTALLAAHAVVVEQEPCKYTLDIELRYGDSHPQVTLPAAPTLPISAPEMKVEIISQKTVLSVLDDHLSNRRAISSMKGVGFDNSAHLRLEKPGWFRGELHAHTLHSDGAFSLAEIVARALDRKLDFLVIADHNTMTAFKELENLDTHGLLVIPAIELTTFHGHALALGVNEWIDWRTGYQDWTIEKAADLTRVLGGVFIMAHPNDIGNPFCTGCKWEYADFDLSKADGIEIWNGMWRQENEDNLHMWQKLQACGSHLVATAGCDFHDDTQWSEGAPFTYIYAEKLTVPALLQGIRHRQVWISNGPHLDISVSDAVNGDRAGIGETFITNIDSVNLNVIWTDVPSETRLVVICRKGINCESIIKENGYAQFSMITSVDDDLWIELYSRAGNLLAMTNPVSVHRI